MEPKDFTETIVNLETGETTVRDYTEVEIAQVMAEREELLVKAAKQHKAEAAKAAATAKLAALGLTTDDLKALGL